MGVCSVLLLMMLVQEKLMPGPLDAVISEKKTPVTSARRKLFL